MNSSLITAIQRINAHQYIDDADDEDDLNLDLNYIDNIVKETTLYIKSPYYKEFLRSTQDLEISTIEGENNIFYCPELLDYYLKHFIPYLPLWSGLLNAGNVNSNAPVESWFNKVKNNILNKKRNLKNSEFVYKLNEFLLSCYNRINYNIPKNCVRKKRIPNNELDMATEKWSKKHKTVKTNKKGKNVFLGNTNPIHSAVDVYEDKIIEKSKKKSKPTVTTDNFFYPNGILKSPNLYNAPFLKRILFLETGILVINN